MELGDGSALLQKLTDNEEQDWTDHIYEDDSVKTRGIIKAIEALKELVDYLSRPFQVLSHGVRQQVAVDRVGRLQYGRC